MDGLTPSQVQRNLPDMLTDKTIDRFKKAVQSGKDKTAQADDDKETNEKLEDVAKQFESIFVNQLLSTMRSTVPKSGLLNSFSGDMYQSMLDQEISKEVSKERGIGLADSIYRQLVVLDEKAKKAHTKLPAGNPETVAKTYGGNQ